MTARMMAVETMTKPIKAKMDAGKAERDQTKMMTAKKELSDLYVGAGVKPWKMLGNFVQLPVGFGCWRTFSNMATVPVAGLATGGTLWFTNLTVCDPYYVLPVVTVFLQHISARVSPTCVESDENSRAHAGFDPFDGNCLRLVHRWVWRTYQRQTQTKRSYRQL